MGYTNGRMVETMSENKFQIFKEITIGGLRKEQLIQRLSEAGIQFNKYANTLFEHPQFSPPSEVEKVKLAKVALSDLGLQDTCSTEEFSNRASMLGLRPCPLYLAAFLRLEYLNQPDGPYLTVASPVPKKEPPRGGWGGPGALLIFKTYHKPNEDDNYPSGFYLRNFENALWLRGYKADGFSDWPGSNEFIFIARQP
ncbi:MAG: hypothetical protein IPM97_16145 [Bdellovibrionaceae bacterium]|nr:hypothetical protein [Pseudobdellovibrionaceae bacterium]